MSTAGGERPAPTFPVTEELLGVARRLRDRGLCPECFGRAFGRHGHGLTNPERSERVSSALGTPGPTATSECALCRGLFHRWDVWVARCRAAADGLEWHRFACGSRWDPEILAHEESIWAEVGSAWGESARGAFNRELGKRIEEATGAAGSPERPEVVLLADLPTGRAEVTILPLYLEGRYRKFDRTLPQTRWPCRRCRGRGCETCQGTGKTYSESVEELVAAPVLEVTRGRGTRFHGMGREDIDARMLGRGRPFVLEILEPKLRTIEVGALEAEVARRTGGRVEVNGLRLADGARVVAVKEASPEKSYRVEVLGASSEAKINEALTLATGRAIAQRTPTRVAHRRSDRVRPRRIVSARLEAVGDGRFTLELRAEAGTYIKEWVEGDGGRTDPNLAQLLGVVLRVDHLDVLEIHDTEA